MCGVAYSGQHDRFVQHEAQQAYFGSASRSLTLARDPADRTGHDAALVDLARWALVRVPSKGVLAPDEPHAFTAIQDIARDRDVSTKHLGSAALAAFLCH
jgi:hypothetical protein